VATFSGDVAPTASGDLWTSVDYQPTAIRLDPTGGVQQTITTAGNIGSIAVNPATQDVYVTNQNGAGHYQVEQYTAAGVFVRAFAETADNTHPLYNVAVNGVSGDVYVSGDFGIARYGSGGGLIHSIGTQALDLAVEPATGDVLVGEYPTTITRLSPALDNPQLAFSVALAGNRFITGISAGLDGVMWASYWNDCRVDEISPLGVILRTSFLDCGTSGNQMTEIEADSLGGAWVPNNSGAPRLTYFATDPPSASFTANPSGPVPTGTHVDFTSTSSDGDGTIVSTLWDLDNDGQFDDASGTTAGRTFAAAGDFTVRLKVVDDERGTKTHTLVTHVSDQAPTVGFTVSPAAPEPGQTITLTSTSSDSDGSIASTDWDLDDDGNADDASGSPVTTSFAVAGSHHVRLRVEDDSGNIATLDKIVDVNPAGSPGGAGSFSVTDSSVAEGADGQTAYLSFVISLASALPDQATVDYEVTPGTAQDGVDFASRAHASLVFAPGQTTKTVTVPVFGDDIDEADETATITLSAPQNGTLGDATGTGTITDDDPSPVISVPSHLEVRESAAGVDIPITLSGRSQQPIVVTGTPASGEATAPADFPAAAVQTTIAPGKTTGKVRVPIVNENLHEPDEAFTVAMTSPAGPVSPTTVGVVILNDEADPALSATPVDLGTIDEGTAPATTSVDTHWTLNNPNSVALTLAISDTTQVLVTHDCLAGQNACSWLRSPRFPDMADLPREVTIPAGTTQVTVPVSPIADNLPGDDDQVALTGQIVGHTGSAQGVNRLRIHNDDAPRYNVVGNDHDAYIIEGQNPDAALIVVDAPTERDDNSLEHYRFRFAPGTQWSSDFRPHRTTVCRDPAEGMQGWRASNWCGASTLTAPNASEALDGGGHLSDGGIIVNPDGDQNDDEVFPIQLLRSGPGAAEAVVDTFQLHVFDFGGPPVNVQPPELNATPVVGSDVGCLPGTWLRRASGPFTFRWLAGTTQVGTGATYRVKAGDGKKRLRCAVTGTNGSGTTEAMSASEPVVVLLAPAAAVRVGGATFAGSASTAASRTGFKLPVTCDNPLGSKCTTKVVLSASPRRAARAAKAATMATGGITLAAGMSGELRMRLTSAGRSRLGKTKGKTLKATAVITVVSGGVKLQGRKALLLKRR
jgi:hypothetical protein